MNTLKRQFTATPRLYWRKTRGCWREFGLIQTIRRTGRELIRLMKKSDGRLDISLITENLAIGAAPRSLDAMNRLNNLGFRHVIDLRAERKQSDVLASTKDISVHWVPTYDDWMPKPPEFFRRLMAEINVILSSKDGGRLFLCCGAGEHRAPLAGVLALVSMGHSLELALELVQKARAAAELLPVYKLSLVEFVREQNNGL